MKNLILLFALALFALNPASANPVKPVAYDYISIVAAGNRIQFIHISKGTGHHERHRVKNERGASFDFSKLFAFVNKYEKQGYEVYHNNIEIEGENTRNYFLLRKPKP